MARSGPGRPDRVRKNKTGGASRCHRPGSVEASGAVECRLVYPRPVAADGSGSSGLAGPLGRRLRLRGRFTGGRLGLRRGLGLRCSCFRHSYSLSLEVRISSNPKKIMCTFTDFVDGETHFSTRDWLHWPASVAAAHQLVALSARLRHFLAERSPRNTRRPQRAVALIANSR